LEVEGQSAFSEAQGNSHCQTHLGHGSGNPDRRPVVEGPVWDGELGFAAVEWSDIPITAY